MNRNGKCGEKLQDKSAYSSIKKKYYYYSHKHTCGEQGINRIKAEVTHNMVIDWLKDISLNREKPVLLKSKKNCKKSFLLSALKKKI